MQVRGTQVRYVMPATELAGDRVINPDRENLGKIEDFAIDLRSGCVAYAVLSFGGILGLGDKFFAVPMDALALDEDERVFILNVSKDKLKSASGFDKDNWPDMADEQWGREIHSFFGTRPHWEKR